MSDASLFFVNSVSVETLTGEGAYGEDFADPVTVACFIDDSTHLVRNKDGEEVVSNTVLYADSSQSAAFAVDSRVTVNGRTARVITLNAYDSVSLGLPDHVEVHLT
jgi:hypothetical protein